MAEARGPRMTPDVARMPLKSAVIAVVVDTAIAAGLIFHGRNYCANKATQDLRANEIAAGFAGQMDQRDEVVFHGPSLRCYSANIDTSDGMGLKLSAAVVAGLGDVLGFQDVELLGRSVQAGQVGSGEERYWRKKLKKVNQCVASPGICIQNGGPDLLDVAGSVDNVR